MVRFDNQSMGPRPGFMLPGPRREKILTIVEEHGFAKVSQLSRYFGVSNVTIRTDLDALATTRAVERVHGGAVSGLRARALERPFEQSLRSEAAEKRRIGEAAAHLVRSYQAVMIDVGTTTTAVARALAAREDLADVVIITNALNIALEFERAIPRFTVIVTGGTLRPEQHSLVDPLANLLLERVQADVAFVGCTGLDVDVGITNANVPEAEMKRRMIRLAHRGVVVADSSKLGLTQLSRFASISEIDTMITGAEADAQQVARLRDAGLEVLLASDRRSTANDA